MTEPLAIVLAGIGGALVSGIVAILSSTVSLRAVRQQIESQAQQHAADRTHQIVLGILHRRHTALEEVWHLLFILEKHGSLSVPHTSSYVRNMMWLPLELQKLCLGLLSPGASRSAADLAVVRERLMDEVKNLELH